MTELEKLIERCKQNGCVQISGFHAPNFEGMTEEYAAAVNKTEQWLRNPKNNIISRLKGEIMLLGDTATQRTDYKNGYPGEPIPLTGQQKSAAQLAELLKRTVQFIEDHCNV